MLKALSVRNYVLIDSLEIDFPEGLIIITGQTGAGKSIILGALSLLMGAKADAEAIAEGAETCSVEAEFEAGGDAELLALLKENDLGEGGSLILRRVVNRSGRSRAFVNDFPVNLPLLTAVAGRLVDIHSQHQNLLLADHRFQLSALDLYAGNGELLENCREAHSDLLALRSELSEVSGRLASLNAERDYNESVFRRLDGASLKDGELEELEAEQERLANASRRTFACSSPSSLRGMIRPLPMPASGTASRSFRVSRASCRRRDRSRRGSLPLALRLLI